MKNLSLPPYDKAYKYLTDCGFTILEKNKKAYPKGYYKKFGEYKYIVISDDKECYLKTNNIEDIIEFALEINRLENEFYDEPNKKY